MRADLSLEYYQVRKYWAWCRHATLAMLAHAFLAGTARAGDEGAPAERGRDTCAQGFALPRTYAPPAFVKDETGRGLILCRPNTRLCG